MPKTNMDYGTIHSPVQVLNTSGEILPAVVGYRYEIDSYDINVVSADSGATIKVGFGASSDDPEFFYTESSDNRSYQTEFPSPGRGKTTNLTGNTAVTITITGTNVVARVSLGYHLVRMVYPVTPS